MHTVLVFVLLRNKIDDRLDCVVFAVSLCLISTYYAKSADFDQYLLLTSTIRASNFKFGTEFGFAKAHHKTTPRGKVGVALG